MADGKVTGGKLSNNHSKNLGGKVETGDLKIENGMMTGKVTATVDEGGGVTAGKYEFAVNGPVVGSVGAGSFETSMEGKGVVKKGRYWCVLFCK